MGLDENGEVLDKSEKQPVTFNPSPVPESTSNLQSQGNFLTTHFVL